MIKIIDKYLIKELIYPFFFGIIAFTSISAGIGVLPTIIFESTRYNMPVDVVLRLFASRLPEIIVYTFPTSILLAALIAFNRLSADSEVTAFKSGGISLYRLQVPALIIGLLVSFMTIAFNEIIVPEANKYNELVLEKAKAEKRPVIKESIAIPEYEGGVLKRNIFAGSLEDEAMKKVNIIEYDQGVFSRAIFAEKAMWQKNGGWTLYNGIMHVFSGEDKLSIISIQFEKEFININYSPDELMVTKKRENVSNMDYGELKNDIMLKNKAGIDTTSLRIRLYQKLAIPFACLIFTLLGGAMGIGPVRGSNSVGIGISLLVVVVYYLLLAVGQWMGTYGLINAVLAAWLPNIVTGIVGIVMLVGKAE